MESRTKRGIEQNEEFCDMKVRIYLMTNATCDHEDWCPEIEINSPQTISDGY
jgi:hypothetical protein